MGQITWLPPDSTDFPETTLALEDPNGLLAAGGDLQPRRLIAAYSRGIFPWYSENQPLLWWTPDPRLVLFPAELHIGRSTRKLAAKAHFEFTVDEDFPAVIARCASAPRDGEGTWITNDMRDAYIELHRQGYAHSVEVWQAGDLVGGLYGIALGKVFFGESMFSAISGASRLAFVTLCNQLREWKFELIDCQVYTDYLLSFGAKEISRSEFELRLQSLVKANNFNWQKAWTRPKHGL